MALLELICAGMAGVLWYVSDGSIGFWPLLISAIPWTIRAAGGRFPIHRTRFDLWLLILLLSGVVGWWASHTPDLAEGKFWLLVGGMVVYYAIAAQPSRNVWFVTGGIGAVGALVALYFMLTNDWAATQPKFPGIHAVALQWQAIRPNVLAGSHALHPNVAAGIMAVSFPLLAAFGLLAVRRGQWAVATAALFAALLLSAGLALTSSRGAWLALGAGLVGWLVWVMAEPISRAVYLGQRTVLVVVAVAALGLGLTTALLLPDGLVGLLNRLPGPANAGSRWEIIRDASDLVGDFPFTGAGLASFDGLYSQYIRVIPNHVLIHGHNFYLDLALEQGLIALMAFGGMTLSAFWWLAEPRASGVRRSVRQIRILCGAAAASLIALLVHGVIEDPFYGSRALLLLFVPFGLTAAIFPRRASFVRSLLRAPRPVWITAGLLGIGLIALALAYRAPLVAAWQANLGAVEMARVELVGYPTNEWSDGDEVESLQSAAARFEVALSRNPRNRTALHRLGLIAMLDRDHERATTYLAEAAAVDSEHRGIAKALGYSLAWAGRPEDAAVVLTGVPEAAAELGVYEWWWSSQGRDDLSQRAAGARAALAVNN